ncbi:unnamed protein product [Closterium sp. NIES-65]|nr:unnamed protein product [Closterium sp. NIES-65]
MRCTLPFGKPSKRQRYGPISTEGGMEEPPKDTLDGFVGGSDTISSRDLDATDEGECGHGVHGQGTARADLQQGSQAGTQSLWQEGDQQNRLSGEAGRSQARGQHVLLAGGQQELSVGGEQEVSAKWQQELSVGGEQELSVKGQQELQAGGQRVLPAGEQQVLPAREQQERPAGEVQELVVGGQRELHARGQQELPTGGQQELPAGGQQELPAGGQL